MARVLLNNLWKIYPGAKDVHPAVQDFNLEIGDGEFVVFVGPSGCGKSTTLRMIAGLESITKGEIYIDDLLINNLSPKDRNIAMVFQNYALYPNLSVFENIAFGLRLRREQKYIIEEKVGRTAKILEIDHLLDRLPRQVSGGQRQRVALGRAVVRNPKVFLMDEPLSNLDAKMRVQTRMEIIKLQKQLGATTVYVTHDQIEAMTMGDRIVVMNNGIIQQVGSPEEIYNNPANRFVGGFIGSPPMNFIEGRIRQTEEGPEFTNGRICLKVPLHKREVIENDYIGSSIVGGIRPEHMRILGSENTENLDCTFKGTVDATELIGADKYVYISAGGREQVIVRTPAKEKYEDGEAVAVSVDMDRFLYFNRNTGIRII